MARHTRVPPTRFPPGQIFAGDLPRRFAVERPNLDVDEQRLRLFGSGGSNRQVDDGCATVEVAVDPAVINPSGRRRFDFCIAVEAAPAVARVNLSLATWKVVAHQGDDHGHLAWRNQIRDIVLVGSAVAVQMRYGLAVYPEPALCLDAAQLQPNPLALPGFREWKRPDDTKPGPYRRSATGEARNPSGSPRSRSFPADRRPGLPSIRALRWIGALARPPRGSSILESRPFPWASVAKSQEPRSEITSCNTDRTAGLTTADDASRPAHWSSSPARIGDKADRFRVVKRTRQMPNNLIRTFVLSVGAHGCCFRLKSIWRDPSRETSHVNVVRVL